VLGQYFSTLANATNSPLLRLPAKIRNIIFKLASSRRDGWIALYYEPSTKPFIDHSSYHMGKTILERPTVTLTRVCRQIYADIAPLIYSQNCFSFQTST
jgi:hypothetical protein